jgi:hypothetical protein
MNKLCILFAVFSASVLMAAATDQNQPANTKPLQSWFTNEDASQNKDAANQEVNKPAQNDTNENNSNTKKLSKGCMNNQSCSSCGCCSCCGCCCQ